MLPKGLHAFLVKHSYYNTVLQQVKMTISNNANIPFGCVPVDLYGRESVIKCYNLFLLFYNNNFLVYSQWFYKNGDYIKIKGLHLV
jgi:hypothetical protein